MAPSPGWHGITRRGFLLGAVGGLASGVSLTMLASRWLPFVLPAREPVSPDESTARTGREPAELMPGRYPGRVIEVRHPRAVSPSNIIDRKAVDVMVDRGMAELTGGEPGDVRGTWGEF